jgi:hypothetical protein
MPNFVFSVVVTTDTFEHAEQVMQEYLGDQEPIFESGVEIDYQIDWKHPSGVKAEVVT